MTDQVSTSNAIRSELVDIATEFLKNPKIVGEQLERKREFLQKKGLTDTEINYAFQLIPEQETTKEMTSNDPPSFLYRFSKDLAFAGFLVLVIKLIKQSFHSNQSNQENELNETIQNLQKSVHDMQTSIVKLEQTADQLNSNLQKSNTNRSSSSSIEEIKQELQGLKGLFLSRSQFSQVPPKLPSWQSNPSYSIKTNQTTTDSDNDGIIVISEQDKRSDDDN